MSEKYSKLVERALRSKSAEWFLAVIAFTESSFLPILIDPFQVVFTLARTERWFRYVIIITIASVLGGVAGYALGALFFDVIAEEVIETYGLTEEFGSIAGLLGDNVFLMTLVGAITPLPYKIVALAAGFLKVNILVFIFASIIGRFVRFFLVGFLTKKFGEEAQKRLKRHTNMITIAIVLGIILYIALSFV